MFSKSILDIKEDTFKECSKSINVEDVVMGRKGTVLVDCDNDIIPIVRTTTIYNEPVQNLSPFHYDIINKIKENFQNLDIEFNNALIEIYDSKYRKMKFHTDQSLDLEEDSYICLFSCYENMSNNIEDMRKLKIKNKITNECSEFLLENNSVILFSTLYNHKYLHKIILESHKAQNRWLGITFRLSKTFIKFINNNPHMCHNDEILRIASDEEKTEFYKHKGIENKEDEYTYPEINYTISASDQMPIK
jgi:hypothetical protein